MKRSSKRIVALAILAAIVLFNAAAFGIGTWSGSTAGEKASFEKGFREGREAGIKELLIDGFYMELWLDLLFYDAWSSQIETAPHFRRQPLENGSFAVMFLGTLQDYEGFKPRFSDTKLGNRVAKTMNKMETALETIAEENGGTLGLWTIPADGSLE